MKPLSGLAFSGSTLSREGAMNRDCFLAYGRANREDQTAFADRALAPTGASYMGKVSVNEVTHWLPVVPVGLPRPLQTSQVIGPVLLPP
jgi:hypothetical protein